jgi:transposase
MIRRNLEGIDSLAQVRQTNGFLEALNGPFPSATRRARGFTRLSTLRTVIVLIAGHATAIGGLGTASSARR